MEQTLDGPQMKMQLSKIYSKVSCLTSVLLNKELRWGFLIDIGWQLHFLSFNAEQFPDNDWTANYRKAIVREAGRGLDGFKHALMRQGSVFRGAGLELVEMSGEFYF